MSPKIAIIGVGSHGEIRKHKNDDFSVFPKRVLKVISPLKTRNSENETPNPRFPPISQIFYRKSAFVRLRIFREPAEGVEGYGTTRPPKNIKRKGFRVFP